MPHTALTALENIDKHIEPLEWKTDTGHAVHGVLYRKDSRLILAVNSKELTETITFEYIYREDGMGNRRVLYPYDMHGSKSISYTNLSESSLVEVFMLIDESNARIPESPNNISFTYDSFLWSRVPEDEDERAAYDRDHEQMKQIETPIGKVTISFNIYHSYSAHPCRTEKRMDEITVLIERDEPLPNSEILMWHERFTQLFTFIHKERVMARDIRRGEDSILIPSLLKGYTDVSYAWRYPVSLLEFSDLMREILPVFISSYDNLSSLLENIAQYYYDYPFNPPDTIQLLRLFVALEQCAIYAQKKERILNKALSQEEKLRAEEFKVLLRQIASNEAIGDPIKNYLKDTAKKYYVTSGSLSASKHKINALAKLLQKEYGVSNNLTDIANVELILKMRNMIAHGHYEPSVQYEFYRRRDIFGQDIEQCLRMYLLRALGASTVITLRHKDPLKARRFNAL